MSKVSIQDVAKHAGVSIATVSYVINNTKMVKPETRSKVEQSIKTLDYSPNQSARMFKTGRSRLIGFIVPDIANTFFATLIEAVENKLAGENYKLLIVNTKETKDREIESIKALSNGWVDGLILASTVDDYSKELKRILPTSLPVVLVDRTLLGFPFDQVIVDCYSATYKGVEHLVKLGHKKIGYISGLGRISTTMERSRAYIDVMNEYHLYDEALIQIGDSMRFNVASNLNALLDIGCTALVIANNVMTSEALIQLASKGIVPSKDIDIVGFKDSNLSQFGFDSISFVYQPTTDLGDTVGNRILDRIKHPNSPYQKIELTASFFQNTSHHRQAP